MSEFIEIMNQDIPELEKLTQGFKHATDSIITYAEHEIELARALQDKEKLVKEQIKLSMAKHAQTIYEDCFLLAYRRRPWPET